MKQQQNRLRCASLLALLATLAAGGAESQSNDAEAAALLLRGDFEEQVRAIEWARSRPPAAMEPVLRDALITTLDRAIIEYNESLRAWARGEAVAQWREETDITGALLELVTAMRDRRALPVLARSASTGWMAIGALLEFGEEAVPALNEVALSRRSENGQVSAALYALRMMLDKYGLDSFRPETTLAIRDVAADRLSEPYSFVVLRSAIDLASTLNDPDLDGILRSLASDRDFVVARGVLNADQVKQVRKQAADRLAGVPPPPNPRRR